MRPYLLPLTRFWHVRVLPGAVRVHPRRHPGGLPVRRDRHPHERVRRRLQGAAAGGLAEQLLAAAGGVSGQLVGGGVSLGATRPRRAALKPGQSFSLRFCDAPGDDRACNPSCINKVTLNRIEYKYSTFPAGGHHYGAPRPAVTFHYHYFVDGPLITLIHELMSTN